ncbi:GNAT family N-acetyltransferase [Paenibacillus contaminans]|uniref:GNAT family N-acetyltransferase n=1 Tax=Paenibacillus contaminans TaxID=450362 RepID=A0A329M0W4_9BACL|nr:GNAT family N-acetyltransferase [Paenibacillus contaminans]RAV13651.1 GNAT family N-acetyltransferase [Paenibacillus contaminans]
MNITVVNLADRLEYLNEVSEWFWHRWGAKQTLENMKYTTLHSTLSNKIPLTYIALCGERLVGTVAIWRNNLRCRQDLYPWMTNLYVTEDMQNKGVETLLQNCIIEVIRSMGYKDLFLICNEGYDYYENTGWVFKELAPMANGTMTKIYQKDLSIN